MDELTLLRMKKDVLDLAVKEQKAIIDQLDAVIGRQQETIGELQTELARYRRMEAHIKKAFTEAA